MRASRIACPNCRTGFKTASALVAGQKIKCPKCGAFFAVPTPSSRRFALPPVRSREGSEVRGVKGGSKKGIFLFVLILLVLLGGLALAIWHFAFTNDNRQAGEGQPVATPTAGKGAPQESTKPSGVKTMHVLVTSGTDVTNLPEPVTSAVKNKYPGSVINKVEELKNSKDVITGYRLGITHDNKQQ